MFDEINNKLLNNIVKTNKNKSSHWQKCLPDNADYLNFLNLFFKVNYI